MGIIDHGEIKAEGTRRELVQIVGQHDRVRLETAGRGEAGVEALAALDMVKEVSVRDGGIEALVDNAGEWLPDILAKVTGAGVNVSSVEVDEPNLESVFLHLTGRALRD